MRFPRAFSRTEAQLDTGDAVPTTPPSEATMDNCMTSRFSTINGWPVQRIAVATSATGSTPGAAAGDLYFWEELTQAWYKVNASPVTLTPGTVSFFDIITLCDPPMTNKDLFSSDGPSASSGAIEVVLVTSDPGTATDGAVYTFAMAPDITTVGT